MSDPIDTARRAFASLGVEPSEWSNGPGAMYGAHQHPRHKVLFCVAGSITVRTGEGEPLLRAGDRLDLPPQTVHTAEVGPEGVTCWEAYLA